MKKTPERIESLSAEYVLGSLTGRARRRFQRWMMESARVRQEVWYWEQKLGQLSEQVPERSPPASVWRSIENRLWPTVALASRSRNGRFWPAWGGLASAAALVMAIVLLQVPEPEPTSRLSGAIVQEDAGGLLWLVNETASDHQLRLRPVSATSAEAGRDYELWVVPDSGDPLSLGVVPVGDVYQVALSDRARETLGRSRTLAVSLEPRGGSPTGLPTGPILHVVTLYEQ